MDYHLIIPDHYYDNSIPVFKPTKQQFEDFNSYIENTMIYGMEYGIIKVIPPNEWLDFVAMFKKEYETKRDKVKIKAFSKQIFLGKTGIYKLTNFEQIETLKRQRFIELANRNVSLEVKKELYKYEKTKLDFKDKDPHFYSKIEREYWRSLCFDSSKVYYGSDMLGSLFSHKIKTWNVNNLGDLLNVKMDEKIPGVNMAYLYFGMFKATFSWHTEDMDLFSINYIHEGAPKQWYSVSQKDHLRFESIMKNLFQDEHKKCDQFIRHKNLVISPSKLKEFGINVNKLVQFKNEFVITFPKGFHSGYNIGYNIAESVNFANTHWLKNIAPKTRICKCFVDCVKIDIEKLLSRTGLNKKGKIVIKINNKKPKIQIEGGMDEGQAIKCLLCKTSTTNAKCVVVDGMLDVHECCLKALTQLKKTFSIDKTVMYVHGLHRIPKIQFTSRCSYCLAINGGTTIKCAYINQCNQYFHPMCAQKEIDRMSALNAALKLNNPVIERKNGVYYFYYRCKTHL